MRNTTDFWVGDRLVRPSLGEIQLGPERVHIEPRSMEVLLALARSPSEVIPKKELIEAVWGDAFVSDEVLTHAIWHLRRAFGDQASDPEFIQTIPKMGYRLIAPVREAGQDKKRSGMYGKDSLRRPLILGLIAIAVLIGASLWVGQGGPSAESGSETDSKTVLLLTMSLSDGPKNWSERLEARLGRALAGPDLEVFPTNSCEAPIVLDGDYCLESKLLHLDDGYEAIARLFKGQGGGLAYSASSRIQSTGENLDAAAAELGEMVRTFLEVIEDPHLSDPDVKPWISLQEHDIRAIRDFLLGVSYVYRDEIGGRHPMDTAIERDRDFVAPRVWRTPALVGLADAAALAGHREALDRLYGDASSFEKAMIKWAIGFINQDSAEQIKQLRAALTQENGNRPVRLVLGASLAREGDLEEAWRLIGPLVDQDWHYLGLYPMAALIAIGRDRIDDIRRALHHALEVETVAPDVLAVMIVLAIYDEDAENEELYTERLELRKRELAPEDIASLDVSEVALSLAARAEAEGRAAIADRLRESAN